MKYRLYRLGIGLLATASPLPAMLLLDALGVPPGLTLGGGIVVFGIAIAAGLPVLQELERREFLERLRKLEQREYMDDG